jgi:hypothetical protein
LFPVILELDGGTIRKRNLVEAHPYLILDAGYEKVTEDGAITSVAVMIAIGGTGRPAEFAGGGVGPPRVRERLERVQFGLEGSSVCTTWNW